MIGRCEFFLNKNDINKDIYIFLPTVECAEVTEYIVWECHQVSGTSYIVRLEWFEIFLLHASSSIAQPQASRCSMKDEKWTFLYVFLPSSSSVTFVFLSSTGPIFWHNPYPLFRRISFLSYFFLLSFYILFFRFYSFTCNL